MCKRRHPLSNLTRPIGSSFDILAILLAIPLPQLVQGLKTKTSLQSTVRLTSSCMRSNCASSFKIRSSNDLLSADQATSNQYCQLPNKAGMSRKRVITLGLFWQTCAALNVRARSKKMTKRIVKTRPYIPLGHRMFYGSNPVGGYDLVIRG